MSERVRIKGTDYVYEVADHVLGDGTTEVWRPGMPGGTYQFPNSILERIAPPLPPEPPVGAFMFELDTGRVWRRHALPATPDGRRDEEEWISPATHGADRTSWPELYRWGVVRLYRQDEQPQEKYERALVRGFYCWMHGCGWTLGFVHGYDPSSKGDSCGVVDCTTDPYDWTPLYRSSRDG